jgi:hypothetical protein
MNNYHMRLYCEEISRLRKLYKEKEITDCAIRFILFIPDLTHPRNVSVSFIKEQICDLGGTVLSKFSRDYSCLIKHGFIKKINKRYVVSPKLYFNGDWKKLQSLAIAKWDEEEKWECSDLIQYYQNCNRIKGRVRKSYDISRRIKVSETELR